MEMKLSEFGSISEEVLRQWFKEHGYYLVPTSLYCRPYGSPGNLVRSVIPKTNSRSCQDFEMTTLSCPAEILRLIQDNQMLACDLETTSLNPRTGKVRLLSLSNGRHSLVMDCFTHDIRQILPALEGKILLAHNALFDLGWLYHLGLRSLPETVCTYLLSQILDGTENAKGWHSLGECSSRWLKKPLNKELQQSDWSGPLSSEQIEYSRQDSAILCPLFLAMSKEIESAGLMTTSEIELQCLPAWVWLCQSGVEFNRDGWLELIAQATEAKASLMEQLDAGAPVKDGIGLWGQKCGDWKWTSWQQVADVFQQLGSPLGVEVKGEWYSTTNDAALAVCPHPMATLLRDFREQDTLLKMFGQNWLSEAAIENGRLYPGWRQIGTASGRTSCRDPNCEQIPRNKSYRRQFRAPAGRVLVKAVFGQLQMRLACNRAQDRALYDVFASGVDVHTMTARSLTGKREVTPVERQIAKSANFLMTFAGSAEALRVYCKTTFGLTLTENEAKAHRAAFFRAYPGLERWHRRAYSDKSRECRTRLGRRRKFWGEPPSTFRLNTPVQGDEADLAKMALGALWRRRAKVPSMKLVLFGHDEVVVEADENEAEDAKELLVTCMMESGAKVLDPVPCEVEDKICRTWAGDPL